MNLLARPRRYKFNSQLQFYWGSTTLNAPVISISANGLFIQTEDPLWIGATFSARLMVDPPIEMYCTVSRVDPGRGMAVRIAFATKNQDDRFSCLVAEASNKAEVYLA
jgi:hypothetical protein